MAKLTMDVKVVRTLVVDGNYLAWRSWHSPGLKRLKTSKGTPSGLFYGVVKTIRALRKRFKVKRTVIAFDGGHSGRRRLLPEYKEHRNSLNRDAAWTSQVEDLKAYFAAKGYVVLYQEGIEADDLISLWSLRWISSFEETKSPIIQPVCIIVSSDTDLLQLVRPGIMMYNVGRNKLYDIDRVEEEYQVHPLDIPAYKALVGDKSDNIPGVQGYGPVKAKRWVRDGCDLKELKSIDREIYKRNYQLVKLPDNLSDLSSVMVIEPLLQELARRPEFPDSKFSQDLLHHYECKSLYADKKRKA